MVVRVRLFMLEEKNHNAWCIPTLNEMVHEEHLPVDCCYVPLFVHDSAYLEVNSSDDDESISSAVTAIDENIHDSINNDDNDNEMDHDSDDDDEDNAAVVLENVRELVLLPEGEVPVVNVIELDDICDDPLDDEEEEEEFMTKHTFFDLDQDAMKILSFPDLKTNIEEKLCCRQCAVERRIGKMFIEQKTFKLATVLMFTCKYGHFFTIAPERVDEKKNDSSDNFKSNFYFILAMQILGKGLRTMSIFLGLLGICASEGNYNVWKKIQDKVGMSEQTVAEQCCAENLRKEVEATVASGILPTDDGRVPVACSGDTGWQGGGSRMTYNSQSGHTTLCGARTKKVVAFKFFPNCAIPL